MRNYTQRARDLLESSRRGDNPYERYKPQVPNGVFLKPGERQMDHYEKMGL